VCCAERTSAPPQQERSEEAMKMDAKTLVMKTMKQKAEMQTNDAEVVMREVLHGASCVRFRGGF
jgi:hypothetical protein